MTGIDAKTITCVVEDDNWLHLNYPHHSGGYTTGCLWSLELIAGTEEDARELLAHNAKAVNSYSETDAKIFALEEENKRLREALTDCLKDMDEWISIEDQLERHGFDIDDTVYAANRARAALEPKS